MRKEKRLQMKHTIKTTPELAEELSWEMTIERSNRFSSFYKKTTK